MLIEMSSKQELDILKSLAFMTKYSDKYIKPFESTDFLGMPMIMPQDEFLIRTLLGVYNIKSHQDALDRIEELEIVEL